MITINLLAAPSALEGAKLYGQTQVKDKTKEEAMDAEVEGGLTMGAKSLCIPHGAAPPRPPGAGMCVAA